MHHFYFTKTRNLTIKQPYFLSALRPEKRNSILLNAHRKRVNLLQNTQATTRLDRTCGFLFKNANNKHYETRVLAQKEETRWEVTNIDLKYRCVGSFRHGF